LFDSRIKDFKGKFNTCWLGSYDIEAIFDNISVKIQTIDYEKVSFLVNGHMLKLYQKPKYKGEFFKDIMEQVELQMVGEGVSLEPSSS
jgi:hypothetical protein